MEDAICLDCVGLNETFIHIEKHLESLINYVDDLERYASIFDEEKFNELLDNDYKETPKIICSKCKNKIGYEDYFLKRESLVPFLNEVCKIIGEEVSRYIQFCSNCEIIKELNTFNKIIEDETGQVSSDKGQSVLEFLGVFDIPEDYIKYVIPHLQCRCCGIGQEESVTIKFKESFLIYNDDDLTDYLSVDIDELSQYAEKYFIYLKKIELTNFSSFLRNYPMLGMNHSTGQKLYELFSKMYEEGDFSIIENLKLYRGRTRNKGTEKLHSKQMWNPPIGVSSHGRYNLVGSSVLYLTDNMDYIPAEVNYIGSQELDVATVIINKPLKILDLSQMYGEFGRILSINPSDNNVLKLEYLLTNFIAECCKEIGFHGIKYSGAKKGDYKNYALLKYEIDKDMSISTVETYNIEIEYKIFDLAEV